MADERKYFYEDEVFKLNNKGNIRLGTVLDNSELLDTDESFDGEDSFDKMKPGHIRVAWHPTGEKELIKNKKVRLSNRPLMPGAVVRRIVKGKDAQRGYCRDVEVTASVRVIGTKNVINNVKSVKLIPLREFATSVAVCLDSWVGHITRVNSRLTLQTSDGSRFVMNDLYCACGLDVFHEKMRSCVFSHRGEYYPGQRLWGPLHKLEKASWLWCTSKLKKIMRCRTAKSRKTVEVVVKAVGTESVEVHWRYRVFSKEDGTNHDSPPEKVVSGEDLKRLKMLAAFERCALRVGDRSYYTLTEDDAVTSKGRWRRALKEVALGQQGSFTTHNVDILPARSTDSNETQSGDLVTADFLSQEEQNKEFDNTIDNERLSRPTEARWLAKGPRLATRAMKKKKLRRARSRLPPTAPKPGMRLAVETLSTASRATVVWQDGTVEPGVPSTELSPVDHHHHHHRELFPGDFVCEARKENASGVYGVVQRVDRAGRTAIVQWFRAYAKLEDPRPTLLDRNEVSVYDIKIHPDFQHRQGTKVMRVANFEGDDAKCFVGEILDDYPEGKVRVRWVDGSVAMCWPQDLYKIRIWRYDSDDDDEVWVEASPESSWETENIQSQPVVDEEIALDDASRNQHVQTHQEPKIDPPFPSTESVRTSSDTNLSDSPSAGSSLCQSPIAEPKEGHGYFSIVHTAPDSHHFKLTKVQPTAAKLFLKTVQREIEILRTSLPSGVWIKGFENRMDLYTAMIRGPENTPYEDGLFLFDFHLPAEYPRSPPLCHYISFCNGRLNPNLYEEGKLCVSLLGTWSGKGSEVWTTKSNLLQVIVSIQGLILVSEPYYNEPGYEKQKCSRQGWENSRMYNERVMLKMVQHMGELVLRPPCVFRAEIMLHLAETANKLCDRLESWLEASERFDRSHPQSPASPTSSEEFHRQEMGEHGLQLPEFPLIPASKGLCLSLRKRLTTFREVILSLGIAPHSMSQ